MGFVKPCKCPQGWGRVAKINSSNVLQTLSKWNWHSGSITLYFSIHTLDNIISFREDNAGILNYDKQSLVIIINEILIHAGQNSIYPATQALNCKLLSGNLSCGSRVNTQNSLLNKGSDNFQKLLGAAVFKFPGQTSQFIPFILISFLAWIISLFWFLPSSLNILVTFSHWYCIFIFLIFVQLMVDDVSSETCFVFKSIICYIYL